ncbi:hypothetical protein CPC08DRAFT_729669 [Agrocybe pediades]|nr:hypothetical protein CPC08DRAFT_729669 [Agrocybe pediades]
MTTPKNPPKAKNPNSKSRSTSGSKAPSISSEGVGGTRNKQQPRKRVTIEDIPSDPQSIGPTLPLRTGSPVLEFNSQAASSTTSESKDLPGFRGGSLAGGSNLSVSDSPSFSSLMNNDNSINSEHTVHTSQLEISESSLIFKGIPVAKSILLYDEPIHNSIVCYHESFNPLID